MTHAEFLREIQSYFGEYPIGQKKHIAEYVSSLDGRYLQYLLRELIETVPSQFKTPPDVCMMLDKRYTVKSKIERDYPREKPKELEPPPKEEMIESFEMVPPGYVQGLLDDLREKLKARL